MKSTIFILTLASAILITSCRKDNPSSIGYDKIELTQFIIDNYQSDAKQLFFDEILHNSDHFNYNNPVLDETEVNKILKIIQAVYSSESPERDTVFDVYMIHGYYCYSFNSIGLEVNTELPEIENLSNGIIPTGNTALDDLLSYYQFDSVNTSTYYPDFSWLTIYTANEYNLIPIEKKFKALPAILDSYFNKACIGDGNTITLTRTEGSATITFSIGLGDCPSGCIFHRYWEFRVMEGKAVFTRSYEN